MDLGDIAATGVALAALAMTWFYNRNLALSARESASAARRQVELAETQERRNSPPPVIWQRETRGMLGEARLRNVGTATAYDVKVETTPPRKAHRVPTAASKVEAGHAFELTVFRLLAEPNTMVIHWRDEAGADQSMTTPLP